jgi:(p)ppGpp synthase/HD superfamily hydrolase
MPESTMDSPTLTSRFQRAFTLASEIHATQLRKGTTVPYITHLMSVSALVLEHGGDEDAAIAGLLHDAVEDSGDGAATAVLIRQAFGEHVADIVLACSDAIGVEGQHKPPWRERKASYIAHLAEQTDPDIFLVSACDKLHNARSIVSDLRAIGPALWDRFGEHDPTAHLWYYQSLANCYVGRVPAELSDELIRVVELMRSLVGNQAADISAAAQESPKPIPAD